MIVVVTFHSKLRLSSYPSIAVQWISVVFSDAVVTSRDAASGFVHTIESTYCICNIAVSVLPTQIKAWHWSNITRQKKKARGTEGSLYKFPVVDYTNTLRTNKAFKKIYFHTGAMNDTKYANILTWLSAATHLCLSVFRANVSFEWGMSVHTHTHRYSLNCHLLFAFHMSRGKLGTLAFAFPLLFPHFYG